MNGLAVEDVVVGYGPHDEVLKGVGLAVAAGEMVAIIGPNGAGKSTLLKTIAGLLAPRAGRIRHGASDLTGLRPREIARHGIAYVPQENNVFASLSVRDNLEVAAYTEHGHWRQRAAENFRRFPDLERKAGVAARTLSGGQRQMLAMAMGLMVQPWLLLLDEPSAGLSPRAADELFAAIASIHRDGMTIIMVEQNAAEALAIADRAYLLVDGRNSRDGPARSLSEDPEIRRLFLGA